MFSPRSLSVQSKLIAAFVLLTLVTIGVVSWIGYVSARESLRAASERELVGLQRSKTAMVQNRSAHIEAMGGSIQVVPNSTLNRETIVNFSRPRPNRMELVDVAFSFQDPPYKVRQALVELLLQTEGVLKSPKPIAATLGYGEFSVKYRLIYRTAEKDRWPVRNELVTRIWYMAKRHGFTMPYPVHLALQHQQERPFTSAQPEGADLLAQFPRLPKIPPEHRDRTRPLTFGAGERLFDKGDALDGVYFVVSGTVSLQVVRDGQASEIATIQAGEFCGETGMHGHQAADMRAVALEDTAVVLIAPDVVRHLFEGARGWRARPAIPSRFIARRSNPRAPHSASADSVHRQFAPDLLGNPPSVCGFLAALKLRQHLQRWLG